MPTDLDSYHPFDAGAGAANFESRWRDSFRYMNGVTGGRNGIIRAGFQGQVFADSTGLWVKVPPTEVWIEGHYGLSTVQKTVPVTPNATGAVRIDRVVCRANYVTNKVEYDVVAGVSTTVPPARTQNANQFEISLATISVPNAAATIAAGAVFDARDFVDCPSVLARATADTVVNNSTTLVDVTGLSTVGSADALYLFESFIEYSAASAADLKLRVVASTAGSGQIANTSLDFVAVSAGTSGAVDMSSNAINFDNGMAGTGIGQRLAATSTGWLQMPAAYNVAATAMAVKLQVAQFTANVSNTTVYANSWFKLTRF